MTENDLENISIAIAARGLRRGRVVCRSDDAHLLHEDGRLEETAIAASS